MNLFCVCIWKLNFICDFITMIWRWINAWHSQKYILSSYFLTIKSFKLRSLTRILLQNWKLSNLLLTPYLMFFIDFWFFLFLRNRFLHFILFFIDTFRHVFLSNFSFNFSKWFGNLFIFIISRSSDGTWIKNTTFERILNHLHFFLFATNKFFKSHDWVMIKHFFFFEFINLKAFKNGFNFF